MTRRILWFLLVLAALFGFHWQLIDYMRGFLPGRGRARRWRLPLAAADAVLAGLILWFRLPIALVYILLALLYILQFRLLTSRPNYTDLFLFGGMFAFLLLCIRGVMIPLFALLLGTDMYTMVRDNFDYYFSFFWSLLACGALIAVQRRVLRDERVQFLLRCRDQKRMVCISMYLLFVYLLIESYVYYYNFPLTWTPVFHLITSVVALAAFYIVLWYAIDISAYIEYEIKTRQMEKQFQRQVVHYRQYTNYVNGLRAFKHDYRGMAATARRLIQQGAPEKAAALLGQMDDEMEHALQYIQFSNHVVVDAILQECAGRCRDRGIDFTAVANLPERLGMSDLELCRIFANLMDNAYEACARMERGTRFISVESSVRGDWVTVTVRNSCAGRPQLADGLPVSSKQDGGQHGLGLLSVRTLVESFGGFIQIETDQPGIFTVRLHLSAVDSAP